MKRKTVIAFLLIMAFILAGCGFGSNFNVKMTKPLYFGAGKEMPFEIQVTENGKPVKGLDVSAELTMASMDHGTTKAALAEGKNGTYIGKALVHMGGKYEIAFTLEKDGKKVEKVLDYVVKKPKGVASINGEWIKQKDLAFYQFSNLLQLAINREKDKKRYTGEQLEGALAYWDAQEKVSGDRNQLLTQIIRLRSMGLLAKEKGHKVTSIEIEEKVGQLRNEYGHSEEAHTLISDFGEVKFWKAEEEHFRWVVLAEKVQGDLIEKIKKENPKAGQQEIEYLAQQKYEELLVSQVNSLHIEIL